MEHIFNGIDYEILNSKSCQTQEINPRITRMYTKKYLASKQIRSVSVTCAKQYNHIAI